MFRDGCRVRVVNMQGFQSRCCDADRGKESLQEIRARCRKFSGTCTIGEDVWLTPNPEMSRTMRVE